MHKLKEYSQEARKRLADLNDYSHFYNSYLSEILRVRVPGTVGHHAVKQVFLLILHIFNDVSFNYKTDTYNLDTFVIIDQCCKSEI